MNGYNLRRRLQNSLIEIINYDFESYITFDEKELTQDLQDINLNLMLLDYKTGKEVFKAKGTFGELVDAVLTFYENWRIKKDGKKWKTNY